MKLSKKLQGVIVPIITPKINSDIDEEGLTKTVQFLSDKVSGIFALGTTGEFQHLTIQQKETVLKTISRIISSKLLFFVGISAENPDESLTLLKLAKRHKADAVVFTPLYGQGRLQTKIQAILKYSGLPIILYNNPTIHNKKNLSLKDVRLLSCHPKVIGIKDSSGNWKYFLRLLSFKSNQFAILQGKEELALESLQNGANGIVAGYANIAPELLKELYQFRKVSILNKLKQLKINIKSTYTNSIVGFKNELFIKNLIQTSEIFKL